MELVTIRRYDQAITAHIHKNHLESEGIECFIHDEHIVTMNPLYANAVGGVKLKVLSEDADEALRLLAEMDNQPFTSEKEQPISCPKCGSTALYSNFTSMKSLKGLFSALISLLFYVYPLYYRSIYKCKSCNFEFKKND